MEIQGFYEGLKTDRELNKEHVDAAEHFVRLKTQTRSPGEEAMLSFARGEGPELFEKEAGLPEATKGDLSPRTYRTAEGSPIVGWDSRKGYNYTAVPHEGKYHTLVDHHSGGRVGHVITHPESGAIEQSDIHPSHKHMTDRFHETARAMHQHLHHAPSSEGGAVKTALMKLGYEIRPSSSRMTKRADRSVGYLVGPYVNNKIEGIVETLKKKKKAKEKESCMGKMAVGPGSPPAPVQAVKPIMSGTSSKPPMTPSIGTGASSLSKTANVVTAPNVGAALGALLMGGSTYLASKPRSQHEGKSNAEVELEDILRGQAAEGEDHASFVKKMKNRFTEFNHGVSKVFRENPVKGALLNATVGAALGRYAIKAFGGK